VSVCVGYELGCQCVWVRHGPVATWQVPFILCVTYVSGRFALCQLDLDAVAVAQTASLAAVRYVGGALQASPRGSGLIVSGGAADA
jgi:hypothetical protein